MAWQVTDRGNDEENDNSTALTIPSFTPTADCLLLMCVAHEFSASVSGITGHDGGSAWVELFNLDNYLNGNDLTVWGCFTGSSPSAGTVTVTKSGDTWQMTGQCIEVHEDVNGVDTSGTVANAVGTEDSDAGYNPTPILLTLGAFADSGNLTFGVVQGHDASSGASFPNNPAWSSFAEVGSGQYLDVGYYGGEDTGISITCNEWMWVGAAAFEIKQAAAAGGGLSIPIARRRGR